MENRWKKVEDNARRAFWWVAGVAIEALTPRDLVKHAISAVVLEAIVHLIWHSR